MSQIFLSNIISHKKRFFYRLIKFLRNFDEKITLKKGKEKNGFRCLDKTFGMWYKRKGKFFGTELIIWNRPNTTESFWIWQLWPGKL